MTESSNAVRRKPREIAMPKLRLSGSGIVLCAECLSAVVAWDAEGRAVMDHIFTQFWCLREG